MAEKSEITLAKCIDVFRGIALLDANDQLPVKTMYWLGRFSDRVKSPIKSYDKTNEKSTNETNSKIKNLLESVKGKDEFERNIAAEKAKEMREEHISKMNEILESKESIEIPVFKLSEFIAQEDIPAKNIKKGASLVPQQFFTLMGEFIKED